MGQQERGLWTRLAGRALGHPKQPRSRLGSPLARPWGWPLLVALALVLGIGCRPSTAGSDLRLGEPAPAGASGSTSVRALQLLSPQHGWALTAERLASTADGGRTWATITPPPVAPNDLKAVFFLDPQRGWAVGPGPLGPGGVASLRAFRTTDGGTTWQAALLAPPDPAYTEAGNGPAWISFPDPQHGWVVVKLVTSSAFSRGDLFATSDGGLTWTKRSAPLGDPVRFVSPTVGWMAGGPQGDQLYRTRDGGQTWEPQTAPAPAAFAGGQPTYHLPAFPKGGDGVLAVTFSGAQGGVAFYRAEAGGQSWRLEASLPVAAVVATGARLPVAIVDATTWVVAAPGSPPDGPTLWWSRDRGQRWERLAAAGLSGTPVALEFATAEVGWALTQAGECRGFKRDCTLRSQLFRTTDGGRSWSALAP